MHLADFEQRPGRPPLDREHATGRATFSAPLPLLDFVGRFARRHGITRAEAIRHLIERAAALEPDADTEQAAAS